jgi:CBS domain-containing protein
MKQIPPIKAVMKAFPLSVEADETLARARERMAELDVDFLPVLEGERVVALLAARDASRVGGASGPAEPRVLDACAGEPCVVQLNEPLDRVLKAMAEREVDAAIVLKDGKPVGIFTAHDACRHFAKLLRSLFPRRRSGGVA